MRAALLEAALTLTAQVDPNQGTLRAMQGAKQRLLEPSLYDAVFPVIAFVLVIIVPSTVALWVLYRTMTDKTVDEGET